ncbi:MAG TPA: M50 family metallopeptidase [Anaerolineales bacterium]|nr:M50 family metallopeptidase [Anaerolineales bacterium]
MNETVLTWIIFILAFGGMVIVHELGHFIAARLVKVEVEEFGIGFPTPGAITMFTWQGTRFTFNWLPIGGFVRPKGENDPNVEGGLAASAPWKRLFVLSAGPIMNLATAVLVISIIISQVGGIIVSPPVDDTGPQKILITEVVPNSPAEQAGLLTGDVLLTADGKILNTTDEASNLIKASPDTPILFEVLRDGKTLEFVITPRMNEQAGRALIGVSFCGGCEFKPVTTITENLKYSAQFTGAQIYALVTLPIKLVRGSIDPEQGRLVGLKGIFDIMLQSVSNDVEASQAQPASAPPSPYNAPVQTLSIVALLSISLGIFNLFPFPALDGGRILFVLPELIFRRRVPHQFENLVHLVGMTLLLLVMIYVNVRDFIDPVSTAFP